MEKRQKALLLKINQEGTKNGLSCVKATENEEYSSYLAIISGEVLANLYLEYGSRLLEVLPFRYQQLIIS